MSKLTLSYAEIEKKAEEAQQRQFRWRAETQRTASSGGVTATVDAHLRLLRIAFEPGVEDDVPALEMALCRAVNQATDLATKAREDHEGNAASGFSSRMWEVMFDR